MSWVRSTLFISGIAILATAFLFPSATHAQRSKEKDSTKHIDRNFAFRVERPDSRHWSFRPAKGDSSNMRLEINHVIGGKKDFIRYQIYAYETKILNKTESEHLARWTAELKKQFSEIVEQDSNGRDRFSRYKTQSYTAYGKLKNDPTQIRRITAHIFKHKSFMYTIVQIHEPKMDEKYAKDMKAIEKSFRAG